MIRINVKLSHGKSNEETHLIELENKSITHSFLSIDHEYVYIKINMKQNKIYNNNMDRWKNNVQFKPMMFHNQHRWCSLTIFATIPLSRTDFVEMMMYFYRFSIFLWHFYEFFWNIFSSVFDEHKSINRVECVRSESWKTHKFTFKWH